MSQEDLDALKNASVIIERFGGIRPMAAKVGAPVTTVQGWKKRDVIPGARRDDVLKAANENSIDLSDLLADAPRLAGATISSLEKGVKAESAFITPNDNNSDNVKITVEPLLRSQPKPLPASLTPRIDTTHEELMAAIAQGQKKAVRASVWTVIAFSVILGGARPLAQRAKNRKTRRPDRQSRRQGRRDGQRCSGSQ